MTTEATSTVVAEKCPSCGLPVFANQGFYSITREHWDCYKKKEAEVEDSIRKYTEVEVVVVPRRRRLPEGMGRTALRAKALAVSAIERTIGESIYEVVQWNQQGVYRGPRWDLDAWGVYFKFRRNGHEFNGHAHSLATMTECLKACANGQRMWAEKGDQFAEFNLFTRSDKSSSSTEFAGKPKCRCSPQRRKRGKGDE